MKFTLRLLVVSAFAFNFHFVSAQNGGVMNHWNFGWFAAVEFTTGSPIATSGSAMICEEGSASYSDDQGNLLFYTNGGGSSGNIWPGGVWNRNNVLMPNGNITGLTGSDSSPQSSVVIKKSSTEYYLFTIGTASDPSGVRVSIVDMSLDGGLGDLTLVGDPVLDPAPTPLAEGMTATADAAGTGHWLVVHSKTGNTFYVMHVTSTSISAPAVYTIGSGFDNSGQLKFSIQGDRLAQDENIFDFDNATGVISNPISLGQLGWGGWGRAFSGSGRYFYMGELGPVGNIFQYDLTAADVAASKTLVGSSGGSPLGPFQIGPDFKIYFSIYSNQALGAINQPELPGTSCNYVANQVPLTGNSQLSIPNFVDSELSSKVGTTALTLIDNIVLAPNPTEDFLYLSEQVNDLESIIIFDLAGKEMRNWKVDGNQIDVRELSAGVYLLQKGASSARFVKR